MKTTFFTRALPALFTLSFFTQLHAQPGKLNTSFGEQGIVKQTFQNNLNAFDEEAIGIINLPDGLSIAGISVNTNNKFVLTRLNPDGKTDLSYGKDGYSEYVTLLGAQMKLGADNKIYVAGSRALRYIQVVCFNTDGSIDKAFGKNGIASIEVPNTGGKAQSLAIQNDGKIIVGSHYSISGNTNLVLVRFNADGSLDDSFGNNGSTTTDFGLNDICAATAIQADGKIVIAGGINVSNGITNMSLVRYTANGQLDVNFGTAGKALFPQNIPQGARALQIQPDGKILVGSGNLDFILLRYNTDGTLDQNFANKGVCITNIGSNETIKSIQLLKDGRILAAGDVGISQKIAIGLAQYTSNGFLDYSFAGTGYTYYSPSDFQRANASSLCIYPSGKILVAGSVSVTNRQRDYALLGLESDGKTDELFGLKTGFIEGENTQFTSILLQSDQKIIVAGSSGGADYLNQAFARYNVDGSLDNSFGVEGKVLNKLVGFNPINDASLLPDGKIIAAGTTTNIYSDLLISKYNSDGTPDASFGNQGNIITDINIIDGCTGLAIQEDGKILVAGFTLAPPPLGNGNRYLLVRYLANGLLDPSFGQGGYITGNYGFAQASLRAIKLTGDGKILVLATGTTTGGTSRFVLAQYNSDGTLDPSFGNAGILRPDVINTFDQGNAIELLPNGQILLGGYTGPTLYERDFLLLRYNADGSPDASFGSDGKVIIDFDGDVIGEKLVIQQDGAILMAGTKFSDAGNSICIARYLPDGIIDSSFGTNGKVIQDLADGHTIGDLVIAGKNLYTAGSLTYLSNYGSILSFTTEASVALSCLPNIVKSTSQTECSAMVTNIDPILTPNNIQANIRYTLSGATIGEGSGTASGLVFSKGVTTVTYFVAEEPTKSCSFTVIVNDSVPPIIQGLAVDTKVLWPANQKMIDVPLSYNTYDNCSIDSIAIKVSSNEKTSTGNSAVEPDQDWEIVDDKFIRLKATKNTNGEERIYTIKVSVFDKAGNLTVDSAYVSVPKSMSSNEEYNFKSGNKEKVSMAKQGQIKVHVVPSSNNLVLTFSGLDFKKAASLRVLSLNGQVFETWNNVQTNTTMRVGNNLKPGVYMIELTQDNQRAITKIIK